MNHRLTVFFLWAGLAVGQKAIPLSEQLPKKYLVKSDAQCRSEYKKSDFSHLDVPCVALKSKARVALILGEPAPTDEWGKLGKDYVTYFWGFVHFDKKSGLLTDLTYHWSFVPDGYPLGADAFEWIGLEKPSKAPNDLQFIYSWQDFTCCGVTMSGIYLIKGVAQVTIVFSSRSK